MNSVLKILTATLVLAVSPMAAQATSLKDVLASSMKLYSGAEGICSSTVVAKDILLTANHCADAENLNVRRQVLNDKFEVVREDILYVKAVKMIKDRDVALLQLTEDGAAFIEAQVDIASPEDDKALEIGDAMRAVGYPKAMELTVTSGEYSGKTVLGDIWEKPVYKVTVPITGGNSGGGLYTIKKTVDSKGIEKDDYKLIGVTVAGYRDVSFMNYAATLESIEAALKGFKSPPRDTVKTTTVDPDKQTSRTDDK